MRETRPFIPKAKSLSECRRRKIHEQIHLLHQEAKAVSADVRDKELKLRAEADAIGQQARLELCTELHATLPRELRDMVYDYILGPVGDEAIIDRFVEKQSENGSKCREYFDAKSHPKQRLWESQKTVSRELYWWRDECMGETVARELVERWYMTRVFVLRARFQKLFTNFLAYDLFEKTIKPREVAQHIQILITVPAAHKPGKFQRRLHCLQAIKNKGVRLTFALAEDKTTTNATRRLRIFLELVSSVLYQLRTHGFYRIDVVTLDPTKIITSLFDIPESDFMNSLVSHCNVVMRTS